MAQRPRGQIRISNYVVICAYILLATVFVRCLECGARTTQLIYAWQTTYLAGSRPLCGNPVLEERDWRLAKFGRRERRADGIRMMNVPKKEGKGPYRVIATNKKARRNYEVMDTFKAGIELLGSEVKSCRSSKVNMEDGYAQAKNGQCFLHGVHIAECTATNRYYQHEPTRPRRLLLHKREIKKLEDKVGQKGMTIVPLKIFFDDNNRLKVEIALAQGKNVRDKRDDIKAREAKRDLQRISKNTYSY